MNVYKNLMFLHGHFVDPRDADDEAVVAEAAVAAPAARTPAKPAPRWWSAFARTPESAQRADGCGDAHGCA
ncbi:hypothetical protein ABU614_06245 [Lysobacter firmicutimachus]|uniref:Uncharacterized protein n=1 Tax=Lysobacter firmicutimachus TaxID=1792846 RepID=A0AAU8MYT9_9GAMM|nr:hypothetical protein [Lysobacter antibioticus]